MVGDGTDVALQVADVALMADDLGKLPFAVALSRASKRIIRQNLWVSLGVVVILIPATLFGWAGIGLAVLVHEGSTMVVVINAAIAWIQAHPKMLRRGWGWLTSRPASMRTLLRRQNLTDNPMVAPKSGESLLAPNRAAKSICVCLVSR